MWTVHFESFELSSTACRIGDMTVHFPLLDFKNLELEKVTRYNLNCDKSFIPSLLTSLLFVGYCVGAFAGGTISGPGILTFWQKRHLLEISWHVFIPLKR